MISDELVQFMTMMYNNEDVTTTMTQDAPNHMKEISTVTVGLATLCVSFLV